LCPITSTVIGLVAAHVVAGDDLKDANMIGRDEHVRSDDGRRVVELVARSLAG